MILLDIHVLSESLRRMNRCSTYPLSAITLAELRAGVARLPAGKRQDGLHDSLERQVIALFAGRVRPFNLNCTHAYSELMDISQP